MSERAGQTGRAGDAGREPAQREPAQPRTPTESAGTEDGTEFRVQEPLKRHGDALFDGSGSRHGPGPEPEEEPSQ